MLFVKPLSEAEKETLDEMRKYHPLLWTRNRAHCILLSSEAYKVQEIASIFCVCRQSVSTWIGSWELQGLLGLIDAHRSGRRPKITREQKEELIKKVQESPRSLKKVISEFSKTHQIELSLGTLKNLCKKANLSWKRIRKSLKSKRNQEEFDRSKALIDELIIDYKSGEIDLFYFDESSFSLTPSVPYAWQKINEHIEIPSARSQTLSVLGFMDRNSQLESFVFEGAINTDVVISCFNEFSKNLTKTTIVLVDNAPTHTSKKFDKQTLEWCKQGLVIVPISRYSPELNSIEILWRKIKYEWMPFSAYESFKNLKQSLSDILLGVGAEYSIKFC
jgi:transposase